VEADSLNYMSLLQTTSQVWYQNFNFLQKRFSPKWAAM
jgi:hypothetical protein